MVKHIAFRLVAGLILLVAIAGIAFFAYQAGANHAVVATAQPRRWISSVILSLLWNAIWLFLGNSRVRVPWLPDPDLPVLPGIRCNAHPDMGTALGLAAHARRKYGKWTLG